MGESLAAQAVVLADEQDDPVMQARAWWVLGCADLYQGSTSLAERRWDHALDLFSAADTSTALGMRAYARSYRGLIAAALGDLDAALGHYEDALPRPGRWGRAI